MVKRRAISLEHVRCGLERRANEPSDDLSKHHKDDVKTGAANVFREQRGGNLLIGYAASGIQGCVTLIRAFSTELESLVGDDKGKAQVDEPRGRKYRCANQSRTAQQ